MRHGLLQSKLLWSLKDEVDGTGRSVVERVLELLEAMSRRTAMYVHPVNIATVQSYLHGLQAGCAFGGLNVSREVYEAAAAARGWKLRAAGIVWHMRAK